MCLKRALFIIIIIIAIKKLNPELAVKPCQSNMNIKWSYGLFHVRLFAPLLTDHTTMDVNVSCRENSQFSCSLKTYNIYVYKILFDKLNISYGTRQPGYMTVVSSG